MRSEKYRWSWILRIKINQPSQAPPIWCSGSYTSPTRALALALTLVQPLWWLLSALTCKKQKTAESYPHPSGGLNHRSAMRYTLHYLQRHSIRPSSGLNRGSAADTMLFRLSKDDWPSANHGHSNNKRRHHGSVLSVLMIICEMK